MTAAQTPAPQEPAEAAPEPAATPAPEEPPEEPPETAPGADPEPSAGPHAFQLNLHGTTDKSDEVRTIVNDAASKLAELPDHTVTNIQHEAFGPGTFNANIQGHSPDAPDHEGVRAVFEDAVRKLRALGATVEGSGSSHHATGEAYFEASEVA